MTTEHIFTQTLITKSADNTFAMLTNEEGVFLNRPFPDGGILSIRIQISDANDILESMNKTTQLFSKAVRLGEVVC